MEFHRCRSWRIAIYWEKLAGFWPYQSKFHNYIARTWLILLTISAIIPLVARLVEELGNNLEIVVENVFGLMLCFGALTKRKQVYDTIFNHIDTMRDTEEAKILGEHYNYGLRYSFRYAATMALLTGLYNLLHFGIVFFNYFFNENDMIKLIPFHLEYFVDETKYFYYICVHLVVCVIAFFVGVFASDCAFFMQIQHVCALFEIVTMRLGRTLKWETKSDIIIYNSTNMNTTVHNCISSAINLHLEVIKMVNSIEEIYSVCLFIILVENMVGFGGGLYVLYLYTYDLLQVVKYSTIFIGTAIHFYVMFTQGQKIIDSSLSVYNACYNSPWYNWNKNLRKLLIIMMERCVQPCEITGGSVFVISMETYWKMMKTGITCYTICKIREDFA